MAQARATAASMTTRQGYEQIKDKNGNVIKEVPLDFADPSQYTYPIALLEDAARLWIASKTVTPPLPDELIWRDRNWDNQVAKYRKMLEFYMDYGARPAHLKDVDDNWKAMAKGLEE